jgi:galactose-1-phosphate uridylyltransferase
MAVRFKKSVKEIRLLDPTQGFDEKRISFELRIDPLTRRRARIADLKFKLVDPPDLETLVEKSITRGCPFCEGNLEKMTPKFPPRFIPEGRIEMDGAVVFPNFMPYDQNNALTIFSREHFVPLSRFSDTLLVQGFMASQAFLKKVRATNAKSKYFTINWNYMPPSGGSLVHPHLHLMADKDPSDHHSMILKRAKRFWKKFKVNYWQDLLNEEKKLGERFLGETGNVSWVLNFAPRGMMFDVMGVFREKSSILDFAREDFRDFARGLQKAFRYLEENNLFSFNLALYSGGDEKEYFWTHARLIPRFTIPPVDTSDNSFIGLLHDEPLAIMKPEDVCQEMKAHF